MSSINEILVQMAYYATVMILTIVIMGVMQKGYFWVFIKVKTSFGKYVIVKIRSINRDYFRVGRIEDNDLVYKNNGKEKRINIPKGTHPFYRAIGILWVDVDDEKNAICLTDYSTVEGFDAVKNNDLLIRCLYRPSVNENQQKLILGILFLIIALIGVAIFMTYKQTVPIQELSQNVAAITKGIVVATGG